MKLTLSKSALCEDPAKSLIPDIPQTKAELRTTVKDFPKLTEDPHRLEEFNTVIQTLTWLLRSASISPHAC